LYLNHRRQIDTIIKHLCTTYTILSELQKTIKSNQWTPFIFVGVEIIPFHIWGRCSRDCIVVLTSNHTHGQVYPIQHYVIKSVSDLQTVNGFSGTLVSSTNTTFNFICSIKKTKTYILLSRLIINIFLLCVFTFWVPCYDSIIKQCSVHLYIQLFVGGLMSYLHYLCLFGYSGVQHILYIIFKS
jgi:hypothetical protein